MNDKALLIDLLDALDLELVFFLYVLSVLIAVDHQYLQLVPRQEDDCFERLQADVLFNDVHLMDGGLFLKINNLCADLHIRDFTFAAHVTQLNQ